MEKSARKQWKHNDIDVRVGYSTRNLSHTLSFTFQEGTHWALDAWLFSRGTLRLIITSESCSMVSQGPVPILDDPSSVDAARKRVSKTPGRFAFLRKTKSHPSWSVSDTDIPLDLDALPPTHLEAQSTSAPDLDDPIIDLCEHPSPSKSQDVYRYVFYRDTSRRFYTSTRWAVVFENQRG